MAITISSAVKDGNILIITYSDGRVFRRSIVYRDTVVSTPPDGFEEVGNVYINHSEGTLIVNYNGESIILAAGSTLTGAEIVVLLEALGAGSRLSHDRLDDVDADSHHVKYNDAEALAVAAAAIVVHATDDDSHHAKYTDAEAVTAMGVKADDNSLNHDQADEWGATEHSATGDNSPHHVKYTDAEAKTQAEAAKLDDHAVPDDNTDLDATAALHGLMSKADKSKLDGVASTVLARAFLNVAELNFPHAKNATITLNDTAFDPSSIFQTGVWQGGVGDAGSGSTTVIDANPTTGAGFEASMLYSRIVWDGGSSYGFITAINSATSISIYKTSGTDFAVSDTYVITKAYFLIPTAGYWLLSGTAHWIWSSVVPDKEYLSQFLVNGVYTGRIIAQSAAAKGLNPLSVDMVHLDVDDKVALAVESYAGVDTSDVYGSAAGAHTWMNIVLMKAD